MKKPVDIFQKIYLIILIGSALALAFPTASGIPAFSGGNFIFLKSVGLILFSLTLVYLIIGLQLRKYFGISHKQEI